MKQVHFNLPLFVVSTIFICQLKWTSCTSTGLSSNVSQTTPALFNVSTNVPKNTHHLPDIIEKRSDDSSAEGSQSLFKSLIPLSPFKKPIKHFFRSWFEPDQDALSDEPKRSTFYFTRPQRKNLGSISPASLLHRKLIAPSPIPHASYISTPNKFQTFSNKIINRNAPPSPYSYTYAGSHIPSYRIPSAPNPFKRQSFALGDPANGRGVTLSFGDSPKASEQSYGVASPIGYQNTDSSANSGGTGSGGGGGGLSLSLGGRGGGSGINLSLGGGGQGGSGPGMSFSLGGRGGGSGGGGSGMSLNLGGGGGAGSGMSLNLGGGGVSLGSGGGGVYEPSGSQSYPSYSSQGYGSNSYGGGGSYGNSYNDAYYQQKPKFSITMPSMGKTVIEANLRPTPIKMKINASPKVKITTGTRDPLEKNHDEEVIIDDIFGPPPPFEKPQKKNASAANGGVNGVNGTMGFNMTDFSKYPYPPYPFGYSPYYPQYYQYPYNYYNYNQQYPQQNQNQQYYYNGMHQAFKNPQNNPTTSYQQPLTTYQQPATTYQQPATNYQQPPTTYQQPATTYQQPATNYQQPPTTYQQPAASYQQPDASYQQSATNYQHPPTTYQQPAASYQQPDASYQQPATNYQQPATNYHQSITSYKQPSTATTVQQTYSPGSYSHPQEVSAQKESYDDLASSHLPNSQYMDHNSISYKRSSGSRNYQKDMLTLGSNSIATYTKPVNPKKYKSVYELQESKNHYQYYKSPAKSPVSLASNNYYQYSMDPQSYSSSQGTGVGYSYYNQTQPMSNQYQNYYQQYYNNPYYYNYYNNYYNYAKQYYDSYYANLTNSQHNQNSTSPNITDLANQAYYNRQSITGFNQNNLDVHQSKIFGSKVVKYPGGSTKEEKSKIVVDIRPRVTIKMLNRTEQMQQQLELKHKKKEHIFDTKLTVLLETTTNKPPETQHDSYYDNYYSENVDDFGYAFATTSSSVTTPKPRPSTTTRRRTTTEEPSSEGSEEDSSNGTEESSESSEDGDSSSTTETSDTTNEPDSQEDEETSKEGTTSTTTTEKSTDDEEVIDGNDESSEDAKDNEEINGNEESEDNESEKDNSETDDQNENEELKTENPITSANNVTVSPELVAAMVKALQEALGVTPPSITTPDPISLDQEDDTINNENTDVQEEQEEEEEAKDQDEEQEVSTTAKPKGSANSARTKLIPTVHSALVQNTTHLRLKTPVLSVQSKKAAASSIVALRSTPVGQRKPKKGTRKEKSKSNLVDSSQLTTTSPFIIVNNQKSKLKNSNVNKIIDGNAVLSSFNVDDLSDDERRDMLTNILSIIQNKTGAHNEIENTVRMSQTSGKSTSTKLLPVKTANNVRIVSSLNELTNDKTADVDNSNKQPVYVVLLPQNKKKKK